MANILINIYFWIGASFFFLLMFGLSLMFIVVLGMKTHAIIEFKSWLKGIPIALFFQENRYCDWKPVKPEAGIIQDKEYGAYIINERATYVDKRTKNVLIPFDASVGVSVNIRAAKLIDDLAYIVKDEEQFKQLRRAIANNQIEDSESIDCIKTSIHFGAIKNIMNAIIPHNINAKIEKVIAQRMAGLRSVNVQQVAFIFVAMLGAIIIGAMIVNTMKK